MEPIHQGLICSLFAMLLASAALAQEPNQPPPNAETTAPVGAPSRTGKERMGRKWMDEQRIDNCNVPADKRGSKPRPVDCLHSPSG